MKAATDSIAVIRTRMPYVDRRALSEAWFSALHLARGGRLALPQRRAGDPGLPRTTAAHANPEIGSAVPPRPLADRSVRVNSRHAAPKPALARPNSTEAPKRADRVRPSASPALSRAAMPAPFDASFTLTIEGARVQLLVRRDGPALRVTAICAAAHLESVRKALASADLAMRLRGHVVESRVRCAGEGEVPA